MLTKDWDYGYRAAGIDRLISRAHRRGREAHGRRPRRDPARHRRRERRRRSCPSSPNSTSTATPPAAPALLDGWNGHADVDSAQAAYFAVFWRTLLDDMFGVAARADAPVRAATAGSTSSAPCSASPMRRGGRTTELGRRRPRRDDRRTRSTRRGPRHPSRMGDDPDSWRWGRLHTLTLTNQSFGESGIGPDRVALQPRARTSSAAARRSSTRSAGTRASATASTGCRRCAWSSTSPTCDASRWINLTGASGHAFHPNYADQAPLWQHGELRDWPFTDQGRRSRRERHPEADARAG